MQYQNITFPGRKSWQKKTAISAKSLVKDGRHMNFNPFPQQSSPNEASAPP